MIMSFFEELFGLKPRKKSAWEILFEPVDNPRQDYSDGWNLGIQGIRSVTGNPNFDQGNLEAINRRGGSGE